MDELRIGVSVDASAATSGMTQVSTAVSSAVGNISAMMKAMGVSAADAGQELIRSGVSARTVAVALQTMGATAAPAAAATREMNSALTGMDRTMATATARIIGMEAGMGRLGYTMGSLASRSSLIGPLLSAAFPLTALVLVGTVAEQAYEKMTKLHDETVQNTIAWSDFAVSIGEQATKMELANLRTEDMIAKLEGRPSGNRTKEALMEVRLEAEKVAQELQRDLDKLNELLEKKGVGIFANLFEGLRQTGDIKNALQGPLRDIELAQSQLALATVRGDKEQIDSAKKLIEEKRVAALAIIQGFRDEDKAWAEHRAAMRAQGESGIPTEESVNKEKAARTEMLNVLESTLITMKEIGVAGDHAGQLAHQLDAAKDAKAAADEQRKYDAEAVTFNERVNALEKEAIEAAEKVVDIKRQTAELDARLGEESGAHDSSRAIRGMTEIISAEEKFSKDSMTRDEATADFAIQQDIKVAQHRLAIGELTSAQEAAIEQQLVQKKLAADEAAIAQQEQLLKSRLVAEQQSDPAQYARDLAEYTQLLNKKQQLEQRAEQELTVAAERGEQQRIQMARQAVASMTSDINRGVISWVNGQQTFGRAMQSIWRGIVDTAITSILQIGEKWVVQHYLMAAVDKLFHLQSAADAATSAAAQMAAAKASALAQVGLAGAGGTASMAAAPFPIDLTAPAFGASMAAVAGSFAAFAQGGLVPATGLAMVHGGEMVLPAHISKAVQGAAENGGMGSGGHTFNINYSPSASSFSAGGIKDVLDEHGDAFVAMLRKKIRKGNL
jgi:hypothetical protein